MSSTVRTRSDTAGTPGTLLRVIVYAAAFLAAVVLVATLILVAVDGNPWGLLTVPGGAAVGLAAWGVGHLLEARRKSDTEATSYSQAAAHYPRA